MGAGFSGELSRLQLLVVSEVLYCVAGALGRIYPLDATAIQLEGFAAGNRNPACSGLSKKGVLLVGVCGGFWIPQ